MRNKVGFLSFLSGVAGIITTIIFLLYLGRGNNIPVIYIIIALAAGIIASVIISVNAGKVAVNIEIDALLNVRNMLKDYYLNNTPDYREPQDYNIAHPVKFIFNELIKIDKSLTELKRKIAKHERLFDNMSEGIIITDTGGKILTINPAAKKIFDIEDFCEGLNLVHIIKDSRIISATRNIAEKKDFDNKEISIKDKKGSTYFVFVVRVDIGAENEGIILYIRDMTSVVKAELIRAEFTANVSHELKTPLTSIKGFTELLHSGSITDNETRNKYLDLILLESERLINLINDILQVSELESIRMDEGKSLADVSKIAEETVTLLLPVAKLHHVKLKLEATPCSVEANPFRLKELFINLIENAIKYNKENGSVKIAVSCREEYAVIKVTDSGIGIPQEDKDRVFERFYRVDKGRSKATGGTGLGLSIVKHIVMLYKGTINLESSVDSGTSIEVKLPKGG